MQCQMSFTNDDALASFVIMYITNEVNVIVNSEWHLTLHVACIRSRHALHVSRYTQKYSHWLFCGT